MPFIEIKSYLEYIHTSYNITEYTYVLNNISKLYDNRNIIINIEYKNDDNVLYMNMKISDPLFISLLTDYHYDKIPGLYELKITSSLQSYNSRLNFIFSIDTDLIELALNKLYSVDCVIYSSNNLNLRNLH